MITHDSGSADQSHVVSASDPVFHGVLFALETRRIVPGQRLVESDLASAYQVSRNSVREALQRLAAEGLVEITRNKGAAIRVLSLQETLNVLEVAERIFGLLARAAARAVRGGADGDLLSSAVKLVGQSHRTMDGVARWQARRSYYRALLKLAGSRELQRLVPVIQMPIVHAQHPLPGLHKMRLSDYRAITKEVLSGNEDAADLAAMAHVGNVRQAIVAAIESAARHCVIEGGAQ